MSGRGWYQAQKERDQQARELSESVLGPLEEAFADVMDLIARCFDAALSVGTINDLTTRRKVAVANHAFNLLWSAWDEALAGRYDAATDHWRSIDEAPDFLLALSVNPTLADDMGQTKIDIDTARRTIAKGMNRLKPGEGKRWLELRQQGAKGLQPLAHVTVEATSMALAVTMKEGKKTAILRPGGGFVAKLTLRPIAIYLVSGAISLLHGMAFAFQHIEEVDNLWETTGRDVAEKTTTTVKKQMEVFSVPSGDPFAILVLRSDEELADD